MTTVLVVAALVIWGLLAIRSIRKNKSCGCSGNCGSCSGCK